MAATKESAFGQMEAKAEDMEEVKKNEEGGDQRVDCPVNFNKLSLCALRKYQYKFRLQMGTDEKPLLTREDLIEAIKRHFVSEMKADYNEEIGKFLSFKREENRAEISFHGVRRLGRTRGNRTTRPNPNNTVQAGNTSDQKSSLSMITVHGPGTVENGGKTRAQTGTQGQGQAQKPTQSS